MKCSDLQHRIYPYLDGELDHAERAAFEAHLNECSRCREELAEAHQFLHSLKEVQYPEPSPLYWTSVVPRIHKALEQKRPVSLSEILLHAVFPASVTVAAFIIGMFLLPLQHDYSTDDLTAGVRQMAPEDMEILNEQFSFTVTANPLAPVEYADLHASGDREQILTIFRSDAPALSTVEEEHLRAFDALSDNELGQLLQLSDNSSLQ